MGTYGAKKGQGWGAIAKDLGIKPGSAEFHALKNGDFGYTMDRSGKGEKHGKGGDSYSDGKGKNNGQDDRPMPTDQTGGQGKGKGKKK